MTQVINFLNNILRLKNNNTYTNPFVRTNSIFIKMNSMINSEVTIPEEELQKSESLFKELTKLKISYKEVRHGKVNCIKDLLEMNFENSHNIIKNLFLKDKKKNYFFICTVNWKTVDLKNLCNTFKTSNLRFVDEENLKNILNIHPGCLTPFAVKNDKDNIVKLYFDSELKEMDEMIVHPLHNYSSLYIKKADMLKFCELYNHPPEYIQIEEDKDKGKKEDLIYLFTYILIYLYTYLLIYLFTYILIYLYTYLLIYLFTYILIYLYTYLLIYLIIYLHIYLFT
ncbi:proline--tRNA ligase, putative [Plasmodium malariae]|uniref:Proline--tRNA ligase, putative n=1 Tax=Plasmodium malariae TaxID=5858 RepID=A0A1C3L2M4_PLAMA|nr:proline--tRNA ligase, putative [Plasmodium malariae]